MAMGPPASALPALTNAPISNDSASSLRRALFSDASPESKTRAAQSLKLGTINPQG